MGESRAGPGRVPGGPALPVGRGKVDVQSVRFGKIRVAGDRIVRFVRPVVGFQSLERYAVIEDKESLPVLWMQAIGAPEVLLPVVDAGRVTGGYSVDLTDEEAKVLDLKRAADARLLVILTLNPDPSAITANLRAPIVWNTRNARAMQVVLQESSLSVSHPVGGAGGVRRSNKEVARASPDATAR